MTVIAVWRTRPACLRPRIQWRQRRRSRSAAAATARGAGADSGDGRVFSVGDAGGGRPSGRRSRARPRRRASPSRTVVLASGSAGDTDRTPSFGAMLRPTRTVAVAAGVMPDRRFLLPKGAFIDCTLETAIDSSLPGMTTLHHRDRRVECGRIGGAARARHQAGRRDARRSADRPGAVVRAVERGAHADGRDRSNSPRRAPTSSGAVASRVTWTRTSRRASGPRS